MFEFRFSEDFAPSSNTKEWSLYTHKTEQQVEGVVHPGLFQTTYYEWQMIGLAAIVLLEVAATYWCKIEGVVITAILASIFLDVVLAVVAHVFQKDICRLKNRMVYESDREIGIIKKRLQSARLKQRFFYFLIVVSAVFKIFWFVTVYNVIDATTLFITTCYLVGALLHARCTGYAIFTFIFNRKMSSEHAKYVDSRGERSAFDPAKPIPAIIAGPEDLAPVSVEVGRHRLFTKEGQTLLHTLGVLTDAELTEMVGRQPQPEQKRVLLISGIKHQMEILTQGPISFGDRPGAELGTEGPSLDPTDGALDTGPQQVPNVSRPKFTGRSP